MPAYSYGAVRSAIVRMWNVNVGCERIAVRCHLTFSRDVPGGQASGARPPLAYGVAPFSNGAYGPRRQAPLRLFGLLAQEVAGGADGEEVTRVERVRFQFETQSGHVGVDGAAHCTGVVSPYIAQQIGA